MLVRYRGGEGMLAWAFHRISGVAIWLFLVLHVVDIFLVGAAPDAYDTLLFIYATPPGIIMEWLLGAAVLYHALNGLRIIIMDFWPRLTRYHRELWYLNWALFAAVGVPVTVVIFGQFARSNGVVGMSSSYSRSGRVKPQASGFELAVWYLMRLSGLGLFVLVLSHYLILHVLNDPAEQNAQWIGQFRWSSTFWRAFDWLMLVLVTFHAFMGMRVVIGDMTRGGLRMLLLSGLYLLGILLLVIGTAVVMTLPNVVPAAT